MLKKLTQLILIFLIGVFFITQSWNAFGFSNETLVNVSINEENKLFINFVNGENHLIARDDISSYKLYSQYSDNYSFQSVNDIFILIPIPVYNDGFYRLKILVQAQDLRAYQTNITISVLEWLTHDYDEVSIHSIRGMELSNNGELISNILFDSLPPLIESRVFQTNTGNPTQMTRCWRILRGYRGYDWSPAVMTHMDPIINIVPEQWFFTEGTHTYAGEQYIIYARTWRESAPWWTPWSVAGVHFRTHVHIWEIEASLPFYNQGNATNSNTFTSNNQFEYRIRPVLSNTYFNLVRSIFNQSNAPGNHWATIDPHLSRVVILMDRNVFGNIHIAPSYSGIEIHHNNARIDYERDTFLGVNQFNYTFYGAEGVAGEVLRRAEFRSMISRNTETFMRVVNGAGKFIKPLKIVTVAYYITDIYNRIRRPGAPSDETSMLLFQQEVDDANINISFAHTPVSAVDIPTLSGIFSNHLVVRNYYQSLRFQFGWNGTRTEQAISINTRLNFNFYNRIGNPELNRVTGARVTANRTTRYDNVHPMGLDNRANPITAILTDTQLTFNLTNRLGSSQIDFGNSKQVRHIRTTVARTYQVSLQVPSSTAIARVEIYNNNGVRIARIGSFPSWGVESNFINEGLDVVRLSANQTYTVVIRFMGNQSGNVNVRFRCINLTTNQFNLAPTSPINFNTSHSNFFAGRVRLPNAQGVFDINVTGTQATSIKLLDLSGNIVILGSHVQDWDCQWSYPMATISRIPVTHQRNFNQMIVLVHAHRISANFQIRISRW